MPNKNYKDRRRVLNIMQLKGYSYEEAVERYNAMMEALRTMQEEGIDTDTASMEETKEAFDLSQRVRELI